MPTIVDNRFLDISDCELKSKKIYTSKFGNYLGLNKFQSAGDTFLLDMKIIEDDPFNPLYTIRGEKGEEIVNRYLTECGKDFTWFGKEYQEKKIFDIFENAVFGGVPDCICKSNDKKTARIIEVKTKNIKDYNYLNRPQEEHKAQAQLGAYLSNCEGAFVVYVFFTNEQEQAMMDGTYNFEREYKNVINNRQIKFFDTFYEEGLVQEQMSQAYAIYNEFFTTKRIPLEFISEKSLQKLNLNRPLNIFARGIRK